MTSTDLLERIYRFYPRDMYTTSPGYDDTAERRRQLEAARCARAEYPKWEAMLDRLRPRYSIMNWSLHLLSGGFDPAYSGCILVPGSDQRKLGFHVSFLGPYYGILGTGSPDEESYVRDLTREIEATYGCEPIPPEIGDIGVPDVAVDGVGVGKATIYTCLLSAVWGWSLEPGL